MYDNKKFTIIGSILKKEASLPPTYQGLLKKEASEYIEMEISRIFSLMKNPLTEYEEKRIKELLKKDELTLEEAEELYKITDKLVEEYGEIVHWKLLWYARFWIAYNWRKRKLERKEH